MTTSPSALEDLNQAIQNHNPFDRPMFVKQEDVWNKNFPDVVSLNAHVSNAVFEAIEKVRTGQRDTIGITITAERGLGKSHLISRIRDQLKTDGTGLFIYMSEYSNLDKIKQEFLHTLAYSLRRSGGTEGVMQWQDVATALVNETFKMEFQPKQLVDAIFPREIAKALAKGKQPVDLVSKLRDKILQLKPDIDDPYLIQAIVWTLSKSHANFAVSWLAGKGLAQAQADSMGLPLLDTEDEETNALLTARRILNVVGQYRVVVICFDELDSAGVNQQGFSRAMVVASLAKDIANDFRRGVLLTAMYPETFRDQVRGMPQAEAVTDRIAEKTLDLDYLNSDNVVALVTEWLKGFYGERSLVPPYPIYPFNEVKLRSLGEEKPIVRQVLKWCANNFNPGFIPVSQNPVERAYEKELADLEWSIDDYLDDKETLAKALRLGFTALSNAKEVVENVLVKKIEEVPGTNYIDFKVIGKQGASTTVKIGVAIVQQSQGTGVLAALKHLVDYDKYELTRGCLVRSKQINKTAAQAYEYLRTLLTDKKGEWVLLMPEHIKPLLAVWFVYEHLEDYEIQESQFFEFLKQQKLATHNPLLREILSKPTGKVPKDASNEELPISIPRLPDMPSLSGIPDLDVAE